MRLLGMLCPIWVVQAFVSPPIHFTRQSWMLPAQSSDTTTDTPTVIATGFSTLASLEAALQEAVGQALKPFQQTSSQVDLAIVSISSLYDASSPTTVLQTIQQRAADDEISIKNLIGSSVAGCISSISTTTTEETLKTVEFESIPAVSITLMQLPDCQVQTFHVEQVPDDVGRLSAQEWNRAVGLAGWQAEKPIFMLIPSPALSTQVQDLLYGLGFYWPGCTIIGGIASTVSSLSRAKLFLLSNGQAACYTEGSVGVALAGDVQIQSMMAQGAKPVGGVYQILKGQDSTISVIVLDETATAALRDQDEEDEKDEEDEEEDENMDAKTLAAQTYAKANIPKPPLAEANFIMKSLSDDDQAFMRRQLLIGLEQPGSVARSASELARLAQGQGHVYTVQQVASAGMKDGSVTLPLGSVQISPGMRLRFFVRESEFAKKEVEALWMGYKKRLLNEQFASTSKEEDETTESPKFTPAACFIIPTLDRGNKFFLGKPGFESSAAARIMPGVPCISGFFSNGVIAGMGTSGVDSDNVDDDKARIHGSASGYFLIGSQSGRSIYSPANQAAQEEQLAQERAAQEARAQALAAEDAKRLARTSKVQLEQKAPRTADGELLLKRREVHSGRALTVSTVEWSVAEKTAKPSSTLEGFMWDKETEVDRFRERVPLANLVSQCRLSASDPTTPKPRDFVGPIKQAAHDGAFVIIPECKRTEPVSGSLRRRYDIAKLARELTLGGVPAISVNCDGVLFGGSMEDITKARQASSAAAVEQVSQDDGVVVPPILASDLILYPYQLYKLRLAGADAVNLVAGALDSKDLIYLTKIASSLQLQVLITVTSEFQVRAVADLPAGNIHGIILSNRELEDFSFDQTGEQALSLLQSDDLAELKAKHGDIPVLVEGRVGLIEHDGSATKYIQELQDSGALGAIVGGGLARDENNPVAVLKSLQDV